MEALQVQDDQRGAVAIVVAMLMGILLPVAALVVDIGSAIVAKAQLRGLVDAAALAGASYLGRLSESGSPASGANQMQIRAVVQDVAQKNRIGSQPVTVDVLLGTWNLGTRTFADKGGTPTAVAVSARTMVPTIFGGLAGVAAIPLSASAMAALTPLAQLPAGTLTLPMGIARAWFARTGWENRSLILASRNGHDPCLGWTTFTTSPATTNQVKAIFERLQQGTFVAPAAVAGQTMFQFTGEDLGDAFDALKRVYDAKKDPNTGAWKTVVAVYKQHDCGTPKGAVPIVGFATMVVTMRNHALHAVALKNVVRRGRGGGAQDFGTLGSSPGLVQ